MTRSRNRLVRWLGRVNRNVYRYYQKLEDQIDPQERMVKALNAPETLLVWHAAGSDHESRFRDFLRIQVAKHTTWLIVDAGLTGVAILLMPIPGPNVFGWYPFLRALSHYRALKGARRVLRGLPTSFRHLPELRDLEAEPGAVRREIATEGLKIEGLDQFLKRVG